MPRLDELAPAPLTEDQVKRLQETEKLINAAGNQDSFLDGLKEKVKTRALSRTRTISPLVRGFLMATAAAAAIATAATAAG